jgi:hypothetical protein
MTRHHFPPAPTPAPVSAEPTTPGPASERNPAPASRQQVMFVPLRPSPWESDHMALRDWARDQLLRFALRRPSDD